MDQERISPLEGGYELSGFFPFWEQLTPEQQRRLAGLCTLRTFAAGENIYFHQFCNGGMYYVFSGAIRIYMMSAAGREATIYHRHAGQTGIILDFSETPSENIIPVFQAEEETTLVYLSKADMGKAVRVAAPIQELYMDVTAECVQEVVNSFFSFAFLPLRERLARVLLQKAACAQSATVSATHESLAGAVGTSREVATRALGKLEAEGILRTGRKHIEILDMERLKEIAT
jgi:CRP/FNR family transcriptional regulator